MANPIRILLLADTHLGFDLPVRPRIERRRRGHDFLANYHAALAPALAGDVDLVVHAGDVFDRPSVVRSVAYQAYEPLRRVADRGVPVCIVPGNHERSRMPHATLATHPRVHVFDEPRTFRFRVRGATLALSGFPYERRDARTRCAELIEGTQWRGASAKMRLLCMHHCVEGATVGPGDFVFTSASDVVRPRDVPRAFGGVLSGHIHRHQVLTTGLDGRALHAPVLYPGSIERTSVAEIDEPKGFMLVQVGASEGDSHVTWEFRRLPARPMIRWDVALEGLDARALESAIRATISEAPRDAVLSIRLDGAPSESQWRALTAARMRSFVPDTMNVEIAPARGADLRRRSATRAAEAVETAQYGLFG